MKHIWMQRTLVTVLLAGLVTAGIPSVTYAEETEPQQNETEAAELAEEGRREEVATALHLEGPDSVYTDEISAFTARLTDTNGSGIPGKTIYLRAYLPGVSGSERSFYGTTGADGSVQIAIPAGSLEEGNYRVYAEFFRDPGQISSGQQETYGAASTEDRTIALTVKPASERPAPTEDPATRPGTDQTPTTVSVESVKLNDYYSTASYKFYDFLIAANDANGNPVNEDLEGDNIRLHIIDQKGEETVIYKKLEPAGRWNNVGKVRISLQLSPGTYEYFAEYIGQGNYASSQTPHYRQELKEDGTAEPQVVPSKEPPAEEPGESGGEAAEKKPTETTFTIRREAPEARWYDIQAVVKDADQNPVTENSKGGRNVELYVNGEKKAEGTLGYSGEWWDDPLGEKRFSSNFPQNGEYEIYVKYIGGGEYEDSESPHYRLIVTDHEEEDRIEQITQTDSPDEENSTESGRTEEGTTGESTTEADDSEENTTQSVTEQIPEQSDSSDTSSEETVPEITTEKGTEDLTEKATDGVTAQGDTVPAKAAEVSAPKSDTQTYAKTPETGDSEHPIWYGILLILSAFGLVGMEKYRKR